MAKVPPNVGAPVVSTAFLTQHYEGLLVIQAPKVLSDTKKGQARRYNIMWRAEKNNLRMLVMVVA